MRPLILFDADGTLIDSIPAIYRILEELIAKIGLEKLPSKDDLRTKDFKEVLRDLGISALDVPRMVEEFVHLYKQHADGFTIYPGVKKMITSLSEQATLGIITSGDKLAVQEVLTRAGIYHHFSSIIGDSFFDKNVKIVRLTRKYELFCRNVVYIGDETRDVHAARRARVTDIAVSWGLQSREALELVRPSAIANSVEELHELLLEWLEVRANQVIG